MGEVSTNGYEKFIHEIDQACEEFPKLGKAVREDGRTILMGELDIIDETGKFWESYQVEIDPSDGFPYRFPIVYEVGGKIPRIGDWRIYEDTGACCITVPPKEILLCKEGISLVDFIRSEVLPYFVNQTFRRVEGYYINGEYAHGTEGIYQFYDNILGTKGDVGKTISLMLFIAKGIRPGRTHDCFCGSREKFRRCHREVFDILEGIGKDNLEKHAYLFAVVSGYVNQQ